jgi:prefoldin subunit 5
LKGKHENNSLAIEFLKKEFDDFKKEIKILTEKIIKLEKD